MDLPESQTPTVATRSPSSMVRFDSVEEVASGFSKKTERR